MPWLPARLPAQPAFVWRTPLPSPGLAGLAATQDLVIVGGRDPTDAADLWLALDAATGKERWRLFYLAPGRLDYGNSPRATPLIADGRAYLYGAFGHLHCVDLATGEVKWRMNVREDFGATAPLVWGCASSPLLTDGLLIVNPGAADASLAALDPATGAVRWKTPGEPAAFASFVVAEAGAGKQLVGYDKTSLGGWDLATGKRLWKVVPPRPRDFNVPTPVPDGRRLIVSTENNGTRLFALDAAGRPAAEPLAVNAELAPDAHTPVRVGRRLFGVWEGLHCLDLDRGLKTVWREEDNAFGGYAAILASAERLLVLTQDSDLVLVDARADRFTALGRHKVFPDESGVLAHPALVGDRLYVRGSSEVVCLRLEQ